MKKITSELMKVILADKYRYKDGYMVSSEVDVVGTGNIADLLLVSYRNKEFFEIEIKISSQDLRADLKKSKHNLYSRRDFKYTPSRFFYAIPTKLVPVCEKFISDNKLPYGIIEIISEEVLKESWNIKTMNKHSFTYSSVVRVHKRAKKLREGIITPRQEEVFLKRLSSEVVTSTRKLLEAKEEIKALKLLD